jgi:hypothetical protein
VGDELRWVEGMDLLGHFGFNLVVIPHWNNAEGGTHDTRFCYMGEPRFRELDGLLPADVRVLGLDEHTACLFDLEKEEGVVRGIGRVTLWHRGAEEIFAEGDRLSLDLLRGGEVGTGRGRSASIRPASQLVSESGEESFWERVRAVEAAFHGGLEKHRPTEATNALLELDRIIWKGHQNLENPEFISQAREIFCELLIGLGCRLASAPGDKAECLRPLVEELLHLREKFRSNKQWREADAIRETLERVQIVVEDTREGSRWRLLS